MTPAAAPSSVEVFGLAKSFGSFAALTDVSFTIAKGSTVALLGPSGCGKTTILRCLAGLERPNGGVIRIGGQTVFDAAAKINLPSERRDLGVVFQSYAIWPHMSVAENIGFPLMLRRVPKPVIQAQVARMLDMVGLQSAGAKLATQLSGGQQQRVAIARALISEPRLVLFDEALSNLDAQMREQMRLELKVLQTRIGFTALYVTHDQMEAFALAEHVIVMNRGTIETEGHPETVFAEPATPFVARFMGLNIIEGRLAASGAPVVEVAGLSLRGTAGPGMGQGAAGSAIACIRKEHLILAPMGAPVPPGMNQLPADILASSFLGLSREYLLRVGDFEVKAVSSRTDLTDSRIAVAFEPRHCIVFA
jgi:iron(III) transport system ATP-binding protein